MKPADTCIDNIVLPDGRAAGIAIRDGVIDALPLADATAVDAAERIDGGGALAVPGLVDGHIHLDKTFFGEPWMPHRPCSAGFDVRERVVFEKQLLATASPTEVRAARLVEQVVRQGSTHLRCHVDVDPDFGLANLDAVLAVRERYRHAVDIQIVAFPQSGVTSLPGTVELLDAALAGGADLIGGLDPIGFDNDMKGQLDAIFGIAERHGAGIDIHLHDPDTVGVTELEEIARRTGVAGMQGLVTVSHAYALGDVDASQLRRTADVLARAGVAILTNAPGSHAFPPVPVLREAGVTVFAGNDNIRDAWWPYGEGDMLERAMIIGYRSGFLTDADLLVAFDLATVEAARALRLEDYGLVVGARADIVLLAARSAPEAVVTRPARRSVFKRGRLVARDGVFIATA